MKVKAVGHGNGNGNGTTAKRPATYTCVDEDLDTDSKRLVLFLLSEMLLDWRMIEQNAMVYTSLQESAQAGNECHWRLAGLGCDSTATFGCGNAMDTPELIVADTAL